MKGENDMQYGVSLSTSEKDLKVVYGPYYKECKHFDKIDINLALGSLKYILSDMNDIRKKYIFLGFHLSEFKRCNHYLKFGYCCMEDFCAANLGMDKSAVSRCISVWEKFAEVDAGHSRKMWLDDRYKDYSYSQLCEMVSMDKEKLSLIKPDMTIKQIREIKKNSLSLSDSSNQLDSLLKDKKNDPLVATSQREIYDMFKFEELKGIVKQNYIKKLHGQRCKLQIYDKNGKLIFEGICYNFCEDTLYLRVRLEDDQHIENV